MDSSGPRFGTMAANCDQVRTPVCIKCSRPTYLDELSFSRKIFVHGEATSPPVGNLTTLSICGLYTVVLQGDLEGIRKEAVAV